MQLNGKTSSFRQDENPGWKEIGWITLLIIAGFFMIYFLVREEKSEQQFRNHIDAEPGHAG